MPKKSKAYNRRNARNKTKNLKKKKALRRKTIKSNPYIRNKKLLKKLNYPDIVDKAHKELLEKQKTRENIKVLTYLYTNNIV